MKFDYVNTYYSKYGSRLGACGSFGGNCDSPEEALAIAFEDARETRKLMGFPIEVKTEITFRRSYE